MRDRIYRAWIAIKESQSGTAMVEYAGMLAGIAIMTIAGLIFLGGATGGSLGDLTWTEAVVTSPLNEADYAIEPHACKLGGWTTMVREDETPFTNQGDCIQYANTGK